MTTATKVKEVKAEVKVSKVIDRKTQKKIDYVRLLNEAMTKKGKLLEAYRAFHNLSMGNMLLAMIQLEEIAPVKTFNQWKAIGRTVKTGEKALSLWMPIQNTKKDETGEEKSSCFFMFRNLWFGLYQTEGEEYADTSVIPEWDKKLALKTLKIKEVKYSSVNGNSQGYASGNTIAINPLAQLPVKTLFHELAHVVLGHTEIKDNKKKKVADTKTLTRDIKEVEAEATALLCLESLGLEGAEYCRGYIQAWNKTNKIDDKTAQRIISSANKILKAGTVKAEKV